MCRARDVALDRPDADTEIDRELLTGDEPRCATTQLLDQTVLALDTRDRHVRVGPSASRCHRSDIADNGLSGTPA
jgi:hypothetical protein